MPIIINLDVMMAKRKMRSKSLAERIGITEQNLSILKNNKAKAKEEGLIFGCAKTCIIATLNGYTPQIAVEFGRKALTSELRPSFTELEEYVKGQK